MASTIENNLSTIRLVDEFMERMFTQNYNTVSESDYSNLFLLATMGVMFLKERAQPDGTVNVPTTAPTTK